MRKIGKIGFYGPKTRNLQRRVTFENFGLTFKRARLFKYLGSKVDFEGNVNANPEISDIQTVIFNEVPDRAYDKSYVDVPIGMDEMDEGAMDYSRFGILSPMTEEHTFRMHIDDYTVLGRSLIVGDIFYIPFHTKSEDVHKLWNNQKQFWEVSDVNQKQETEGYIISFSATPLSVSRATNDIPVVDSNEDELGAIMGQLDDQTSADVKTTDVEYDEPSTEEPVDYRYKEQKNFLDRF